MLEADSVLTSKACLFSRGNGLIGCAQLIGARVTWDQAATDTSPILEGKRSKDQDHQHGYISTFVGRDVF